MAKEGTLITKDEEDEIITVGWNVYLDYFKEGYMWIAVFVISAPLTGLGCWCWMVMQSLTAEWMEHLGDEGSFNYYFFKYLYLNGINIIAVLGGFFVLRFYCLIISN